MYQSLGNFRNDHSLPQSRSLFVSGKNHRTSQHAGALAAGGSVVAFTRHPPRPRSLYYGCFYVHISQASVPLLPGLCWYRTGRQQSHLAQACTLSKFIRRETIVYLKLLLYISHYISNFTCLWKCNISLCLLFFLSFSPFCFHHPVFSLYPFSCR